MANTARSPPKNGSQPDLSKLIDVGDLNIIQRKHKYPETDCKCSTKIVEIRKEIKDLFQAIVKSQEEHFDALRKDIFQTEAILSTKT